jgi:hypothetical protein
MTQMSETFRNRLRDNQEPELDDLRGDPDRVNEAIIELFAAAREDLEG